MYPHVLMVLDGWGWRDDSRDNAVLASRPENFQRALKASPHCLLNASGKAVGLLDGVIGNSEVGHLHIGAGKIVSQMLTRIHGEVDSGAFHSNTVIQDCIKHAVDKGVTLHVMGLLSDGGVHSHQKHLHAFLKTASSLNCKDLVVHAFLDGRDTSPTGGANYLEQLLEEIKKLGTGRLGTFCGRYYAMDRDNRWERTAKAYRAMVSGEGTLAPDPIEALKKSYSGGTTDEFVLPHIVDSSEKARIKPGDVIFFFNYRADRARQLTRAFTDDPFDGFDTGGLKPGHYACMARYHASLALPAAYEMENLSDTLGEVWSRAGLAQARIAETEKYAHVTYFFNGGGEDEFEQETRVMVPSLKVATYDLAPEMKADAIADATLARLDSKGRDQVLLVNFANADMVGHTGDFDAAVTACRAVDRNVGRILEKIHAMKGSAIVTSDHGNSEYMKNPDGSVHTAHTLSPVPFIFVGKDLPAQKLRSGGTLANVGPTVLEALGLDIPASMTAPSLWLKE